jgi:AcrR family transcriptional regulator
VYPAPASPRAVVAQERRRRILTAATELFQSRGYLGTTTDEIADAADITKRTLYKHMGSKGQILLEIHEQFIAEGLDRWRATTAVGGGPEERLRALIVEHVRTVADFQPAIRVFFEEFKHLGPEERRQIIARRDAYEAILRETLEEGMESGALRRLDLEVTTKAVLGALTEVYRWYRPDGGLSAEELGRFVADQFIDGLLPEARRVPIR